MKVSLLESCWISPLLFADNLVLHASSDQDFNIHWIDFQLRASKREWNL